MTTDTVLSYNYTTLKYEYKTRRGSLLERLPAKCHESGWWTVEARSVQRVSRHCWRVDGFPDDPCNGVYRSFTEALEAIADVVL